MAKEHNRTNSPRPHGISRREFIKLAAMAGLLAGCRPLEKLSAPTLRRPDAIKMYPDVPSKVVRARHAGVWDGDAFSFQWTHVPLVMAVTDRLLEMGVPAKQIFIFDRRTHELQGAGYPINEDGPGVRCYGTDNHYSGGWTLMDTDIRLSDILLSCDALINMPILKHHEYSGVTFAMKNHFGTFDKPEHFHRERTGPGIVELNALAPIRDRTRLVIGDTLNICPHSATRGGWHRTVTGDSILMSFDPVAHDAVGLQTLSEVIASEERDPATVIDLADVWLTASAELGLGTNDPDNMDLVEVTLG